MGDEGSMGIRWMGAILIIGGCGGFGFSIASAHRRQERLLRQLLGLLKQLELELRYHLSALPELCCFAEKQTKGVLKKVFQDLHRELNWQSAADTAACMGLALRRNPDLPPKVRRALSHLGNAMNRFDLDGQIVGLQTVQEEIRLSLQNGGKEREQRIRSYQTLSLCAGLALVILLV